VLAPSIRGLPSTENRLCSGSVPVHSLFFQIGYFV
jgi:hypothetical protein